MKGNINTNFRVCQDRSRASQSELKAFGSDLKEKRKSSIRVQKDISFAHCSFLSSIMHNAGLLYVLVERMPHNQTRIKGENTFDKRPISRLSTVKVVASLSLKI